MPDRASLEKVLEFANAVREAGGGNPIDALMPAVPAEQTQCLIARNLNFNCAVNGHMGTWYMGILDVEVRDRIAEKLGLGKAEGLVDMEDSEGRYLPNVPCVALPDDIGQVAEDFDRAYELIGEVRNEATDYAALHSKISAELTPEDYKEIIEGCAWYTFTPEDLILLKEMVPYIEEAAAEARAVASLVTEDGRIVL